MCKLYVKDAIAEGERAKTEEGKVINEVGIHFRIA